MELNNMKLKEKPVTVKIKGHRRSAVAYLYDKSKVYSNNGFTDSLFHLMVVCDDRIHRFDAEYSDKCDALADFENLLWVD